MLSLIGRLHAGTIFGRRTRVLADMIAQMMPQGASVLDVGCGDGTIAALIQAQRPDLTIEGIDVKVRGATKIPVAEFDGETLPLQDKSRDVVLFVDVLHHTLVPSQLVGEAARVARTAVIIKDHTADNAIDRVTLRAMDWVGNAPHGIVLPYNYLSSAAWRDAFVANGLTETQGTERVPLYRWPLSMVFGRKLHFIRSLAPEK